MLQLRRHHNFPTWALCVDLAKAFDAANHDLLFGLLLSKHGVPDHLVDIIRQLCHDTEIKLKVGKEEKTTPCLVRVKQGDNMAPVLFLFFMQDGGSIRARMEKNETETPQFCHFEKMQDGRLLGQDWRAKGKLFELCCLPCVDDGSFVFANRKDMVRATQIIHDGTMACFGLIMHVGRNCKSSKTGGICHPPLLQECDDLDKHTPEEARFEAQPTDPSPSPGNLSTCGHGWPKTCAMTQM
jgi:hypothetical protein